MQPEASRSAELSFGADPESGPRLSERVAAWAARWARAHRRLLVAAGLSEAAFDGMPGVIGVGRVSQTWTR
ncbi:hypothetical protein [Sphaerimonospora mesophila]|uniref:hypothetical protein n=1 Tax=Sphaerimonospora mesophila TaxID=37483 RepID=UPI0006E2D61A